MSVLLRYACLGFGTVSLLMFVNSGTVTGQMLATAGGYGVQDLEGLPFYILAALGVLGLTSVGRIVFPGYDRGLGNIAVLAMICVLGAVFVIT